MIKSQPIKVRGVPYPHIKSTGNTDGLKKWSDAIIAETGKLRKVTGPCLVRVTFKMSQEKFHAVNPFGTDLDNLLKRFFDALARTVFSDAPGRDACIVAIEAAKVLVQNHNQSGVDGEIIELTAAMSPVSAS